MGKQTILVSDMMQRGYRYLLSKPAGRNFHTGFEPELTPKEMLRLGVFGGKYMTGCRDIRLVRRSETIVQIVRCITEFFRR